MRIVLITLLWLVPLSPCLAQTAEEAIAFIFNGLEDGRHIIRATDDIHIRQLNKSPAIFETTRRTGEPKLTTTTIERMDTCKFKIVETGDPAVTGDYLIDFQQFVSIKDDPKFDILDFKSACPLSFSGTCLNVHVVSYDFMVPRERLENAITYLRREHCKGSAF